MFLFFVINSYAFAASEKIADSGCVRSSQVVYAPQGVIIEFCFESKVNMTKIGNNHDFHLSTEEKDSLPSSYRKSGILSVVNLVAMKSGVFTNFYVDTSDGARTQYTVISTTSSIGDQVRGEK